MCPDLKQLAGQSGANPEHLDMVNMLFEFLFVLPETQPEESQIEETQSKNLYKCKQPVTRKKALSLLLSLTANCEENFTQLLAKLFKFHRDTKKMLEDIPKVDEQIKSAYNSTTTNKSGSSDHIGVKASVGYVGLYNFGCTCYMNSLL
jgi:hypothetical protein